MALISFDGPFGWNTFLLEIKEAAQKVDLSSIVEREAIRAETIDVDVELGRAADRKTLSENFIPAFGERNITEHVRNSSDE